MRPKLFKLAPHSRRIRRLFAIRLNKLVPRCSCLTSIRFKSDLGDDIDINSDDTLACVSVMLFWLFSLLEIKNSYVLSRSVYFNQF